MPFYLRNDTDNWFKNIKDQKPYFETKFDIYYLCLMLGIASGKKSKVHGKSETTEFQKNFVKTYIPVQKLIIGLMISSELKRYGISPTEKTLVQEHLASIIDPDVSTKLTDKGLNTLNEYASGGYEILAENFTSKPYDVEEFLTSYCGLLDKISDQ
ncbi:hypothetical protein [Desulfovibrio ferrophilus]|uniref:DNA phosphorothioation-associated protein 4 n=1 Tax=Desulfovibrio ferrophilus TaxID=241368 RepID=A0A2Z6AYT9_9BACT|nr:hypothetical protein [Desulfovibrio ferrophilus]BBD08434.1 uncharacterized protein DFE_1708 [Desulfovibrio ferrophilus]